MKKKVIIGLGIAAVFAAFAFWKSRLPKVEVLSVDWQNNVATVSIDGTTAQISENSSVAISGNYTVGFVKSFRQDRNGMAPTSIALMETSGAIVKTLSRF